MPMSPSHHSFCSLSLGKSFISCKCLGFLPPSPKRASNRLAPTDTVTVRPSGGTVLPSRPLPAGGSFSSTLRGSWRVRKPLYANCRIRRSESTRFLLHPSVITSITPFLNFAYLFINKWSETGCKGTKKAAIESPTVVSCLHYIQPPQQPLHTHSIV